MVIQQDVPSRILNDSYNFGETPTKDWRSTVFHNRAQSARPRDPPAVAQSRLRDVVIGPTSRVQADALLRAGQRNPPGPRYEESFHPVQ